MNDKDLTPEKIGVAIRSKRKAAGMNIAKAAALCNVGIRFLSELERGKPTAEIGKTLHVIRCMGVNLRLETSDKK